MLTAIAVLHFSLASADAYGGSVFVEPPTTAVRLTTEAVTFVLGKRLVSVEARYMFKNTTDSELSLKVGVPLVAENTNRAFQSNSFTQLSATWDGAAIQFAPAQTADDINRTATSYVKSFVTTLVFKPNATHVLRLHLEYPIGNAEYYKFVAWRTSGASSWAGSIERADYSFKFDNNTVFQIIDITPNWGWQWGNTGAYVKRTAFEPSENETIRFRYYPPGF